MVPAPTFRVPPAELPDYRRTSTFVKYISNQDALAGSRQYLQEYLNEFHPLPLLFTSNSDYHGKDLMAAYAPITNISGKNTRRHHRSPHQYVDATPNILSPHSATSTFYHSRSSSVNSDTSTCPTHGPSFSSRQSFETGWTSNSSLTPSVSVGSIGPCLSPIAEIPDSILHIVMGYVLELPRNIILGSGAYHGAHDRWQRQNGSANGIDIRQIVMHPVFMISRQLRKLASEAVCQMGHIIVDVCPSRLQTGQHRTLHPQHWWLHSTEVVKNVLLHLRYLQIRVLVPSVESAVIRGAKYHLTVEDEESNWRVKEMKLEQQMVIDLQEKLQEIANFILGSPSYGLDKTLGVAKRCSLPQLRGDPLTISTDNTVNNPTTRATMRQVITTRQPLKGLEIVLVKPTSTSVVLPETLDLLPTWAAIPVAGRTNYILELDGYRILWATQNMGRWIGREPEGAKLLRDLRALKRTKPSVYHRSTRLNSQLEFTCIGVDNVSQPRQETTRSSSRSTVEDALVPPVESQQLAVTFNTAQSKQRQHRVLHKKRQKNDTRPTSTYTRTGSSMAPTVEPKRCYDYSFVAVKRAAERQTSSRQENDFFQLKRTEVLPTVEELQWIAQLARRGLY